MAKTTTNYRWLEGVVKGFANHRRLQILEMLRHEPDLSVDEITGRLKTSYINTSDHLRKMATARLITKRNEGNSVMHALTARGRDILEFCKKLK